MPRCIHPVNHLDAVMCTVLARQFWGCMRVACTSCRDPAKRYSMHARRGAHRDAVDAGHQGGDQALARGRHAPARGAGGNPSSSLPQPVAWAPAYDSCILLTCVVVNGHCLRPPLQEAINAAPEAQRPKVFISTSAVGGGRFPLEACLYTMAGLLGCSVQLSCRLALSPCTVSSCVPALPGYLTTMTPGSFGSFCCQASTARARTQPSARPAAAGATTWPRSAATGRPRRSRPNQAAPSSCAQVPARPPGMQHCSPCGASACSMPACILLAGMLGGLLSAVRTAGSVWGTLHL